MKRIFYFSLVSLLFFACQSKVRTVSTEEKGQIITSINAFMNDWHLAATEADYQAYFSKMDSVSIFIGTDASENWTKPEFEAFSKPYFDQGKAWDFKTLERNVYVNDSGDFVWFDELLDTWMGTCRGSGVIQKSETGWTLKHYVLSVAIPNDAIQQVIDVKHEQDSLFLSRRN